MPFTSPELQHLAIDFLFDYRQHLPLTAPTLSGAAFGALRIEHSIFVTPSVVTLLDDLIQLFNLQHVVAQRYSGLTLDNTINIIDNICA